MICLMCVVFARPSSALAAGDSEAEAAETKEAKREVAPWAAIAMVGGCLGAAAAAAVGGLAIARIGGQALESIARQPEAASQMFMPMVVAAAMVEGGMFFAILVCLLGVMGV